MSGTIKHEDIKRVVDEALRQALGTPIPGNAEAGSVYDILRELDARLPARGKLATEEED